MVSAAIPEAAAVARSRARASLDGTVDMAARRAARKIGKVVDTGQEDTRAEEAARQRSRR